MRRTRGGCGAPLPLTAGAGPFPARVRQDPPRRFYAFVQALGHSDTYFLDFPTCFYTGSAAIGRSAMHSHTPLTHIPWIFVHAFTGAVLQLGALPCLPGSHSPTRHLGPQMQRLDSDWTAIGLRLERPPPPPCPFPVLPPLRARVFFPSAGCTASRALHGGGDGMRVRTR